MYDKYWDSISSECILIEDVYLEGEEKGEEKKVLFIVCSMKVKGFDMFIIVELIGLSLDFIERL